MSERLMENKDGVHFMGLDGEHAVCGDAFDIGSEEGFETMTLTRKKIVTCEKCLEFLDHCSKYGRK